MIRLPSFGIIYTATRDGRWVAHLGFLPRERKYYLQAHTLLCFSLGPLAVDVKVFTRIVIQNELGGEVNWMPKEFYDKMA